MNLKKNFQGWTSKRKNTPESEELQEQRNDPRVQVFIENYRYCPDQNEEGVICMPQSQIRNMFQAYTAPNGYDPIIRILNQLKENGFHLQVLLGKDEFILPVQKIYKVKPNEEE